MSERIKATPETRRILTEDDLWRAADRPWLVGNGPVTFSTSCDLELKRPFVIDANDYYCELGVRTDATKKELAQAYVERNGQDDPRLTYIFKQLLNPDVRAAYDATPLGSVFYDDYVEAAYRARLAQEMVRARMANPGLMEIVDEIVSQHAEEILDLQWRKSEDSVYQTRHERGWQYAYYQWLTDSRDVVRLQVWQEGICRELGRRKEVLQLAVGIYGKMSPSWIVERVGYRTVAFLHEAIWPTHKIIEEVCDELMRVQQIPIGG